MHRYMPKPLFLEKKDVLSIHQKIDTMLLSSLQKTALKARLSHLPPLSPDEEKISNSKHPELKTMKPPSIITYTLFNNDHKKINLDLPVEKKLIQTICKLDTPPIIRGITPDLYVCYARKEDYDRLAETMLTCFALTAIQPQSDFILFHINRQFIREEEKRQISIEFRSSLI